jgi:UTP--glucose-1-phosphate uridylyltransferase
MEILPKIEPGRGNEIQLTDALKELLKHEEVYAVAMECSGYDTGNVLSWLEANVALTLDTEEYGPALRDLLEKMLGMEG